MFQFLKTFTLYEKLHNGACISHVPDEIGDDGQTLIKKKFIALEKFQLSSRINQEFFFCFKEK
jgi:hypothetical protein